MHGAKLLRKDNLLAWPGGPNWLHGRAGSSDRFLCYWFRCNVVDRSFRFHHRSACGSSCLVWFLRGSSSERMALTRR